MTAYVKDILRTIKKERKRLIALIVITILGVTMTTGLQASCDDLRYSADEFFDDQNLHDLLIQSTLGLTDEDVKALASLDDVEMAEGIFSETVEVELDGGTRSAEVRTFSADGIDVPYLVEGRLPENGREIAVPSLYLKDTGKKIGDRITIIEKLEEEEDQEKESDDDDSEEIDLEEEETPNFPNTEFVITGTVLDVSATDNLEGSISFRNNSITDYTFFVLSGAVETDYYTEVVLIGEGTKDLFSFSKEYEQKIASLTGKIEKEIKEDRQTARYEALLKEASDKISDAEEEMQEEFDKAEKELSDAEKDLKDGWKDLEDGEKELKEKSADARKQIADARKEIEEGKAKLKDGNAQLDDAERQIVDGEAELNAGEQTLIDGEAQWAAGARQLSDSRTQLDASLAQLEAGEAQLKAGREQLEAGKKELEEKQESTEKQLEDGEKQLLEQKTFLETTLEGLLQQESALSQGMGEYWPAEQWEALKTKAAAGEDYTEELAVLAQAFGPAWDEQYAQLAIGIGQTEAGLQQISLKEEELDQQKKMAEDSFAAAWEEIHTKEAELEAGEAELVSGRNQIESGYAQLAAGEAELEASRVRLEEGRAEWLQGKAELEDAKQQLMEGRLKAVQAENELSDGEKELNENEEKANKEIADAVKELKDGRKKLEDGQKEYEDGLAEYIEKKADAEEAISDAWDKLDDLEMATWYVQNRSDLNGYSNITADAGCIESLGSAFSLMFLVIAVLISLTTISRMVEEDRGLLGTYQALGFTDREIRRKYLVYCLCAGMIGGLLGNITGYIALPKILFSIFSTMYTLPFYHLSWNGIMGVGAVVLFLAGIMGAAWITSRNALKHMPAVLMQPKAPKAGTRILLEYWKGLWKRLSFLNKVTARNLFRYKKRLLMTVFGIAGCTGLLLCGFAIKNTVDDLLPRQYDYINRYDIMAVTAGGDDQKNLLGEMNQDFVQDYMEIQVSSAKLFNDEGDTINLQLYVVDNPEKLMDYVGLMDQKEKTIDLKSDGFYITENAGTVLGFSEGDQVTLQDLELNQVQAPVKKIIRNYLGNSVYVTREFYEKYFDDYEANGVLLHLTEDADSYEAADVLKKLEGVLTLTSTQEMKDDFSTAFVLITMVVYIIILMAGALAFVVLFTLATTNISERCKEIATIKVLGFFDPEVHRYVNKESLILTGIGILAGLPLGYVLLQFLMQALKLPSINFAVTIHTSSYVIAVVLSIVFALLVNLITDRVLDRINPAEALKSVE